MVIFQALTWNHGTIKTDTRLVYCKLRMENPCIVTTHFSPYFFIKLPKNINTQRLQVIYNKINKACPDCLKSYNVIHRKDVWGFQNSEKFAYMQLFCYTAAA